MCSTRRQSRARSCASPIQRSPRSTPPSCYRLVSREAADPDLGSGTAAPTRPTQPAACTAGEQATKILARWAWLIL